MFDDLIAPENVVPGLFDTPGDADRDARVMMALDQINRRWGRNSAIIGAAGLRTGWTPKFERRSPRYTTKLSDLPLC